MSLRCSPQEYSFSLGELRLLSKRGSCAGEDGSMDCVKVIDGVEMVASVCIRDGSKLTLNVNLRLRDR